MQFADYVVGFALQTLNRCLVKISSREGVSCNDERLLREHVARLQSLWQLMQVSVGKLSYSHAAARLREAQKLLPGPALKARAAEQLLDYADDKTRPLLEQLWLRDLAPAATMPLEHAERLGCLLQEESAAWRERATLREISSAELLEHGIGRAYAKAERLSRKLAGAETDDRAPPGPRRLRRLHRWVGHVSNHMELLRPALDEEARTCRWHFSRLETKLEQQLALELLARALVEFDLKAKAQGRLVRLIGNQRRHLDRQRGKLTEGAFATTRAEYVRSAALAIEQLGLDEITLLPLEAPAERAG